MSYLIIHGSWGSGEHIHGSIKFHHSDMDMPQLYRVYSVDPREVSSPMLPLVAVPREYVKSNMAEFLWVNLWVLNLHQADP